MDKITAIVLARMNSSRCPGKNMRKIGSIPVIEIVLRRLSKASNISNIVLATSTNENDDILEKYVQSIGFDIFRGSEDDIIMRLLECSSIYSRGRYFLRCCADNVFIDKNEIDKVVKTGMDGNWDYVGFKNDVYPERISDFAGEFYKIEALQTVSEMTSDKFDREHVFPFFEKHPEIFKTTRILTSEELHTSVKLDLDYPEDLELLRNVANHVHDIVEATSSELVKIANTL